jgi:hypothetical protein
MNQIEKLSRRHLLSSSLKFLASLGLVPLATQRADQLPQKPFCIEHYDPEIGSLIFGRVIPLPKYSLYAPVKASITLDDDGCDVFHYQGLIVGFWWQPEAWVKQVGWVYQVFLVRSDDPHQKPNSFVELLETEITPIFSL